MSAPSRRLTPRLTRRPGRRRRSPSPPSRPPSPSPGRPAQPIGKRHPAAATARARAHPSSPSPPAQTAPHRKRRLVPRSARSNCARASTTCGRSCAAWVTSTRTPPPSTRRSRSATISSTGRCRISRAPSSACWPPKRSWPPLICDRFQESFHAVDKQFRRYFQTMFRGGSAKLVLTEENDWENGGVDLAAQPPGKRVENLAMLSGGERSLTAIALLFALLEVSPAPFCVLDEVDAALDEANVGRFVAALKQLAHRSPIRADHPQPPHHRAGRQHLRHHHGRGLRQPRPLRPPRRP